MADISKIKVNDTTYNIKDEEGRAALAAKVLYYANQAVNVANNAQIMRIPSSGTDPNISIDTVVLECTFANASRVTSNITWTSYTGYIVFVGTCTAATTANVTIGQKGN